MSFWINDQLGVAFEDTYDPDPWDSGDCMLLWDNKTKSFSNTIPRLEEGKYVVGARRVSEDEAEAFAESTVTDPVERAESAAALVRESAKDWIERDPKGRELFARWDAERKASLRRLSQASS